jgi:2-dehydro-3-deoxygluconokinase
VTDKKLFLSIGECMVELAPTADGRYERNFAGDTFNTCYYARNYLPADWSVEYVSAVGTDEISETMLAFLAAQRIGTSRIARVAGRSVGLYMIQLNNGERKFSYWRSHSAAKTLADDSARLDGWLSSANAIFFSGITIAILSPKGRKNLFGALARARNKGATIAFDPNIRLRLWPDPVEMRTSITRAAAIANLVLPSFEDEANAFGDATPTATVARYLSAGAQIVVVKDGAQDVLVGSKDHQIAAPVAPVDAVVDATAAGDSFNGAFLSSYMTHGDVATAARLGAAVASRVIGFRGALAPSSALPREAEAGGPGGGLAAPV